MSQTSSIAPATSVLLEDAARRERAKNRLYVICQLLGWGLFLATQVGFSFYALKARGQQYNLVCVLCLIYITCALGLLVDRKSVV